MSINSTGINESAVRMQNMAMGLGTTQSSALGAQSPNFHIAMPCWRWATCSGR
jgi:hypothetical protein